MQNNRWSLTQVNVVSRNRLYTHPAQCGLAGEGNLGGASIVVVLMAHAWGNTLDCEAAHAHNAWYWLVLREHYSLQ